MSLSKEICHVHCSQSRDPIASGDAAPKAKDELRFKDILLWPFRVAISMSTLAESETAESVQISKHLSRI
jgi:hypothetical protein